MIFQTILTSLVGIALSTGSGAAELRIFSYNIKHGQGMDGKIDLARIAAVIAAKTPDLVALQEVEVGCARSGNIDTPSELAKLLGMEARFSKSIDFQGGEYGVAVLSKLPVIKASRHVLPGGNEGRTALEVQVKAGEFGEVLSFVSVHNDWESEAVRSGQTTALSEALKTRGHPVILAGDFNTGADSASMSILTDTAWKILDKKGQKTSPADFPTAEIDFFIHRGLPPFKATQVVIEEKVASDHRPIFAILMKSD